MNEQQKQVWGGCQTMLGCGSIVVLVIIMYWVTGFLPRSVPARSSDVIVFISYKLVQNAIFWCGLFGGVFIFVGLASARTWKSLALVVAIFTVAVIALVGSLYSPIAAITFHRDAIDLHYVWPRSSVRISASDITSVSYDQGTRLTNDTGTEEYNLVLETKTNRYRSFGDTSLEDMLQTRQRIATMTK